MAAAHFPPRHPRMRLAPEPCVLRLSKCKPNKVQLQPPPRGIQGHRPGASADNYTAAAGPATVNPSMLTAAQANGGLGGCITCICSAQPVLLFCSGCMPAGSLDGMKLRNPLFCVHAVVGVRLSRACHLSFIWDQACFSPSGCTLHFVLNALPLMAW